MKKLYLLFVAALLCASCSQSMRTPIIKPLQSAGDFPSLIVEGDTIFYGLYYYDLIRKSVDKLLNKPAAYLSYDEQRAIELFEKVTYKDCYNFSKKVMDETACSLLKKQRQKCTDYLNGKCSHEDYEKAEHDYNMYILLSMEKQSSDLYFLVVETEILGSIIPYY